MSKGISFKRVKKPRVKVCLEKLYKLFRARVENPDLTSAQIASEMNISPFTVDSRWRKFRKDNNIQMKEKRHSTNPISECHELGCSYIGTYLPQHRHNSHRLSLPPIKIVWASETEICLEAMNLSKIPKVSWALAGQITFTFENIVKRNEWMTANGKEIESNQ